MGFQEAVLQLGPVLFQVVGQAQQKQLQRNISLNMTRGSAADFLPLGEYALYGSL